VPAELEAEVQAFLVKEHPGVVALEDNQIQEAAEGAEAQQELPVVIV
jgi:chemotaxis signal transduction protein